MLLLRMRNLRVIIDTALPLGCAKRNTVILRHHLNACSVGPCIMRYAGFVRVSILLRFFIEKSLAYPDRLHFFSLKDHVNRTAHAVSVFRTSIVSGYILVKHFGF